MNDIDLTKILKDCPKDWKFWSPLYDEVKFSRICQSENGIMVGLKTNISRFINSDATITSYDIKSPTIMLYPSKDQRDWNKFSAPWYKKEKFDPKTLQPFDKVFVRDSNFVTDSPSSLWKCQILSFIREDEDYPYKYIEESYSFCIPYNDETKHLVGTAGEAPEFYRYWEY